jgi:Domain of unknown function (DUF4159)
MRTPGPRPVAGRLGLLRRACIFACGLVLLASAAIAQRGFRSDQIRWATPESFDGAVMFCRISFRNNPYPYGDGGGWYVDYPRADQNLSFRFSELTTALVSRSRAGDYNHVVVRLTDPLLFRCPFVMLTEPGGAYFDEDEARGLREYLMKGGFLWADDFWGNRAWRNWSNQLAKALSPDEYPPVDVPLSHELFHMLYDVRRIPQIPSIGFWMGTGGRTSERGPESAEPHVRAIHDDRGRIMVLMTHNTDFGDAFEREGDNHQYFLTFAPEGYAFGINSLIYALTH